MAAAKKAPLAKKKPATKKAPLAKKKPATKKAALEKSAPLARARAHALGFPGATEDFPWGETVVKVAKKVFVFLGHGHGEGDTVFGLSVKLPLSGAAALSLPFASPTGYGLGKAGWVSASFTKADNVPLDLLEEWIEESYSAVAPKKLVAQLDATRATSTK